MAGVSSTILVAGAAKESTECCG